MAYKYIVYLHSDLIPQCPHCKADLSEMEQYLCVKDFANCGVNQDNEGYCRDWKKKKHQLETCWECKKLLAIGVDDLSLYVVACRSETDLRYLELMGN